MNKNVSFTGIDLKRNVILEKDLIAYSPHLVITLSNPVVETDFIGKDLEDHKLLCAYHHWALSYIDNICLNNRELSEETFYQVSIKHKISQKHSMASLNFYITEEVFGLVIGKKYKNFRTFICASLPIFANFKLKKILVKFHPLDLY